MQHARGFIDGCANRVTLISWEAEHTEQQIGQAFYRQKPYYQHITYGLQSDWLHVCKAILLVQTSRAFVQTQAHAGFSALPRAFYWVHIDWLTPGHPMGAGNPTISQETETPSPGRLPAPAAPHNKTYSSASKTNKKNIRHMNYRHW